jgi:hypothetical protein
VRGVGICEKPAVEHANLAGTTLRIWLCAEHSDLRKPMEDIPAAGISQLPFDPFEDSDE